MGFSTFGMMRMHLAVETTAMNFASGNSVEALYPNCPIRSFLLVFPQSKINTTRYATTSGFNRECFRRSAISRD